MKPIKNLEEKLLKKKAKLQKYLDEKNKLEVKVKKLQADVEFLQAKQFEQFKKAAKKEKIEIKVNDIPEILRLIKDFQQGVKFDSDGTRYVSLDESSLEMPDSDNDDQIMATSPNELPTLKSLKTIDSLV